MNKKDFLAEARYGARRITGKKMMVTAWGNTEGLTVQVWESRHWLTSYIDLDVAREPGTYPWSTLLAMLRAAMQARERLK